jgi:hypothetical protein
MFAQPALAACYMSAAAAVKTGQQRGCCLQDSLRVLTGLLLATSIACRTRLSVAVEEFATGFCLTCVCCLQDSHKLHTPAQTAAHLLVFKLLLLSCRPRQHAVKLLSPAHGMAGKLTSTCTFKSCRLARSTIICSSMLQHQVSKLIHHKV